MPLVMLAACTGSIAPQRLIRSSVFKVKATHPRPNALADALVLLPIAFCIPCDAFVFFITQHYPFILIAQFHFSYYQKANNFSIITINTLFIDFYNQHNKK